MRSKFFKKLNDLFQGLEAELPEQVGNPCGSCHACCTSTGLTSHNVTAIELDYIEETVGPEKLDEFRLFLKRDGEIPLCPYYQGGCSIYEVRPYSCRVFGHYRREDTSLPEVCIFNGQEHIFGAGEYRDTVPEADSLIRLSREYWAHRIQRPSRETHYQAAGLEDALGKALDHLSQGDVSSALSEMEAEGADDPFTLYSKSLMLEEAGRPDLAYEVLEKAIEQAPESPDLWHRMGCTLFALGDRDASELAFRRAVHFHPGHGQAWGLLGMHRFINADYKDAASCLQKAVDIFPDNQAFLSRLQQAREACGEVE